CDELDEPTRNAISTNTSVKYASSPEGQDLNYIARDLRCEADWLKRQHKSKTHAKFACFVRGMGLQHPFLVQPAFGSIDDCRKVSEEEYRARRARNRAALQDDPVPPKSPEGLNAILQKDPPITTHKPPQKEGRNLNELEPQLSRITEPTTPL